MAVAMMTLGIRMLVFNVVHGQHCEELSSLRSFALQQTGTMYGSSFAISSLDKLDLASFPLGQ